MEILTTNNLSKKYKGIFAVENVNMHIDEGEIYGFVGENGAGKTTVIRLITGLGNVSKGSFSLFGVENTSNEFDSIRKNICAIVEAPAINNSFTALDNLRCQNIVTNSNKSDDELIDIIKNVGLDYEKIKNKKAKNFSLGMRQRLGIAVVMVSDPKFIILDEPMNGLDPQGFIEMRETIHKLNKEGVTFLISSHILSELEKVCTKIGFISKGKLLEEISMDDLHKKARKKIVIIFKENSIDKFINLSKINDYECFDNTLIIYDKLTINDIISILVKEEMEVLAINCIEESIEDYYMSLMRGDK